MATVYVFAARAAVGGMDVDEAVEAASVQSTDGVACWPVEAFAEGRRAALTLSDAPPLAADMRVASALVSEAQGDAEVGKSPDGLAVVVAAASAVDPADYRRVDWVCKRSWAVVGLASVAASGAVRGSSSACGYVLDVEKLWKKGVTCPGVEARVPERIAA